MTTKSFVQLVQLGPGVPTDEHTSRNLGKTTIYNWIWKHITFEGNLLGNQVLDPRIGDHYQ